MHVEARTQTSQNEVPQIDHSASLPRLSPIIIEDMGQLFSIYPLERALAMAKNNWPQFRFIQCSEDDMHEKEPFRVFNGFSFFLIAASLGCASLTHEPHKSIGLIVAEHEPD